MTMTSHGSTPNEADIFKLYHSDKKQNSKQVWTLSSALGYLINLPKIYKAPVQIKLRHLKQDIGQQVKGRQPRCIDNRKEMPPCKVSWSYGSYFAGPLRRALRTARPQVRGTGHDLYKGKALREVTAPAATLKKVELSQEVLIWKAPLKWILIRQVSLMMM